MGRMTTMTGLVAATVLLAGCASSVPAIGKDAASRNLPGDHAQTARYRIAIDYPDLPAADAPLTKVLHQAGRAAKQEFMAALPDPRQYPEFADRQMQLKLAFSVSARTPRFVSVRERGFSATGGAHPIPVDASFVYDTRAGEVITLGDLFTDPDAARKRLASLARQQLEKNLLAKAPDDSEATKKAIQEWRENMYGMIREGSQPNQENFSEFAVMADAHDKASGLQLIFPPYQVAPYVYGTQLVVIPADAFSDMLKPGYRADFSHGLPDTGQQGNPAD